MGVHSKDKRDIYYRLSKKEGYRARSAYKLKHIDETFNIFKNVFNVVDLCGAPGSWSQYVAKKDVKIIITIDIQEIEPLKDVIILQEDITTQNCIDNIKKHIEYADLVLCDGAPDITGIHDLDEYFQYQLVCNALKITLKICKKGSSFLAKIFRGKYTKYLVKWFKLYFKEIKVVKPISSRTSSIECFIYCVDLFNLDFKEFNDLFDENVEDFEVISCGVGPDPDYTEEIYESENVMRKPINPPYKNSIQFRKQQ